MLVSFAVENWTCFRDRQELSMETAGRVPDEFAFDTGTARYPRLNRVAAIYGPNGSGKSRFVEALSFMRRFVVGSAKEAQAGEPIGVKPFRFDARTPGEPAEFEIAFIRDRVVYEYGFSADSERVREEWLHVRPPDGRLQRWLRRKFDPSSGRYEWSFGPSLRGSRETWRKATRPDALYVSTAVQLNSESLRPVVDWFRNLAIVGPGGLRHDFTSDELRRSPDLRSRILGFLRNADISVSDIRVREEEIDLDEVIPLLPEAVRKEIRNSKTLKVPIPEFGLPVAGADDIAYLPLEEQSDGTRRVYEFAGPWLKLIDQGRVMVVDELDRSLHPHLVRFLVGLINRAGGRREQRAQLVATVHDVTLLQDALDRNQVWFTEKDRDQSASLTALSDYRPRRKESLLRGYLGGRYNAVPNVAEPETIG